MDAILINKRCKFCKWTPSHIKSEGKPKKQVGGERGWGWGIHEMKRKEETEEEGETKGDGKDYSGDWCSANSPKLVLVNS